MRQEIMQIETSRLSHQASPESSDAPVAPVAPTLAEVPPAPPTPVVPLTLEQIQNLQKEIVAVLCTCFDPEVPVNIYELGLIYDVEMSTAGAINIKMTLTSPGCPVAGTLPPDVQRKVQVIPGVTSAKVEVVWDPPWDKSRMSEAAKLQLGIED
jgi:FeS assembly SUF system protein